MYMAEKQGKTLKKLKPLLFRHFMAKKKKVLYHNSLTHFFIIPLALFSSNFIIKLLHPLLKR